MFCHSLQKKWQFIKKEVKMFKHVLEVKTEIAMYNKILLFLQNIFGKPKETAADRRLSKINKIAVNRINEKLRY